MRGACGLRCCVALTLRFRTRRYQISQYDQPLAQHGVLEVTLPAEEGGGVCRIGVTRAHLEEVRSRCIRHVQAAANLAACRTRGSWCTLAQMVLLAPKTLWATTTAQARRWWRLCQSPTCAARARRPRMERSCSDWYVDEA